MSRQGEEGIYIRESRHDILLNSKMEFHQPSLTRIVAISGNMNEEFIKRGRSNIASSPIIRPINRNIRRESQNIARTNRRANRAT